MTIGLQQRRKGFRGGVVATLLVFWVLSSVGVCMAATQAEAAMACCQPADCSVSEMSAQHPCCAIQSNPSQPSASPVVLAGNAADQLIAIDIDVQTTAARFPRLPLPPSLRNLPPAVDPS